MNGDRVGADTLDLRAERVQEMREVLDVRLGGGIAQDRRAARRRRGNERVLRRGDARLVEEHVGADERFRAQLELVIRLDLRTELLERQEVSVQPPAPNDVAARRRQRDLTAAGE